jgi:hypothetical protein
LNSKAYYQSIKEKIKKETQRKLMAKGFGNKFTEEKEALLFSVLKENNSNTNN